MVWPLCQHTGQNDGNFYDSRFISFILMWQVRHGVVPRLLSEILSTRIMVKQAMKNLAVDQKVLKRVRCRSVSCL